MTSHDPRIDAYIAWNVEAKPDATRRKRLATTLE